MGTKLREAARICAILELLPASPRDLSYLLDKAGSVEGLLVSHEAWGSRSDALRSFIVQMLDERRVDYWTSKLQALRQERPDLRYVAVTDSEYPPTVRLAYDRPPLLFYRGTLPLGRATAVVGSRKASPQAHNFAAEAVRALVAAGHVIVSGLAHGIDGLAHDACLRAGGRTVAALGHALDVATYPPDHDQLASRVVDSGALVSQFRPGSPATSSSFVQRNALISAFAEVSLVVAADERSGSRSELEAALAQNRQIVLPGFAVAMNPWMRSMASREVRVHVADAPSEVVEIAAQAPTAPPTSAGAIK